MFKRDFNKAQLCIEQAMAITQKHEILFPFDTMPQSYGITIDEETMQKIQNGEQVEIQAENSDSNFLEDLSEQTTQEENSETEEIETE